MKVELEITSQDDFFNEELVNKYMMDFRFLNPTKNEKTNSFNQKYWDIFIDINKIEDIEFIQKYFDEELVIDLRGKEPFIEVYDDYRE